MGGRREGGGPTRASALKPGQLLLTTNDSNQLVAPTSLNVGLGIGYRVRGVKGAGVGQGGVGGRVR